MEKEHHANPASVYQSIITLYVHEDNLMWGNIRTLAVIQAGVFAASYGVRAHQYAFMVGIVGAFYSVLLFLFILRAEWNRDANLDLKDRLERILIPKSVRGGARDEERGLRFSRKNKFAHFVKGRSVLYTIVISLILIDLILAIYLFDRNFLDRWIFSFLNTGA